MGTQRKARIADSEWESYKDTIYQFYVEQDVPLEGCNGVMDIMAKTHDFVPS